MKICQFCDPFGCLFYNILKASHREGNGTPLQYSCLENPMDRGAWWAAVHGVAKSWTRLSDFTFTFHFCALEKEMATNSSVLAWRIPGTGEPGGLPSMGCTSRTRLKRLSSSSVFSYSYLQSLFPFLSATDQSVEVHQPHPLWNPNISSVSLLSIEADQVRIRK